MEISERNENGRTGASEGRRGERGDAKTGLPFSLGARRLELLCREERLECREDRALEPWLRVSIHSAAPSWRGVRTCSTVRAVMSNAPPRRQREIAQHSVDGSIDIIG